MKRLDDIVDFYLRTDTNNAIMLSGNWGAGKTYYFKHTLKDKISKTNVFNNNIKKYKPILVSLFGLKSVEEIQTEIFLCLYPLLKSSKLKLSATIGKSIAKGILSLKGLGEYSTFVDVLPETGKNVNKKGFINFEEIVVCFDDLERISPNLKVEEIIGFINSLVESENVKVIIIANKGKGALNDVTYKDFEEKIIGNTIEFIPDFRTTFDSILQDKFASYIVYKKFLEENKEFIFNVFSTKSQNLRTLIFALNYFHLIHSEVKNNLFTNSNLKERENEILLNLLKFTIAISIEYKESRISYSQRNGLDNDIIDFKNIFKAMKQRSSNAKNEDEKEKTPRKKFLENYYTNDKYIFYKSVYDFITGGTFFDYSLLLEELKRFYHIQENKISEQYQVLNKLEDPNCFTLTNNEYENLTRKMLNYAFKGNYNIIDYLTIFYFATRFENPLKFDLKRLERRIILGMIKGKRNYKFIQSLSFKLSISLKHKHREHLERIREATLDLNNEILSETKSEQLTELEKLCYADFTEFNKKILLDENSFYFTSIFSEFKADEFYSYFLRSNPGLRWEIVAFFGKRYSHNPPSEQKLDIPFLQKLKERVDRKNKQLAGKNVNGYVFLEFEKQLNSAISNFNL